MSKLRLRAVFVGLLAILAVGRFLSIAQANGELVLFVTGPSPSSGDLAIRDRLEQRFGYVVTMMTASATSASHATGKALVLAQSTNVRKPL